MQTEIQTPHLHVFSELTFSLSHTHTNTYKWLPWETFPLSFKMLVFDVTPAQTEKTARETDSNMCGEKRDI